MNANCVIGNGCLKIEASKKQYAALNFPYQARYIPAITVSVWIKTNTTLDQTILSADRSD